MTNLGSFGEAPPETELDTFTWFGSELRINDELSGLAYVDFIVEHGDIDENDPKSYSAIKEFLRLAVHPDDFDEFWSLGKKYRQGLGDLARVVMRLIEAVTDRPTEQSSDSSTGLPETKPNSTGDSYLRVIQEHETEGRPDIAEFYDLARAGRQAS